MNKKFSIKTIIALVVVMLLVGITTAFAASDTTSNPSESTRSSFWTSIWNILTDNQKTQLADEMEEKLGQDLADGMITQEQYDKVLEAIEKGEMPFVGKFRRGGHSGMKEDRRSAMDEMKSRWDALTDAQKAEIFDLNDQKAAIDSQIIDKYVELGIIDAETAESMRSALESQRSDMRTNSRMPIIGGRGMKGGRISANIKWDVTYR